MQDKVHRTLGVTAKHNTKAELIINLHGKHVHTACQLLFLSSEQKAKLK